MKNRNLIKRLEDLKESGVFEVVEGENLSPFKGGISPTVPCTVKCGTNGSCGSYGHDGDMD